MVLNDKRKSSKWNINLAPTNHAPTLVALFCHWQRDLLDMAVCKQVSWWKSVHVPQFEELSTYKQYYCAWYILFCQMSLNVPLLHFIHKTYIISPYDLFFIWPTLWATLESQSINKTNKWNYNSEDQYHLLKSCLFNVV